MTARYPPAIKRSNGEIKVLYEKCDNIEKLVEDIKERFEVHDAWGRDCQEKNQLRFGELEERTSTTKNFVWSSLFIAAAAIVSSIASRFGF